jgi:hypothetical protein
MKSYDVYFVEQTKDCTGDICGGDDHCIKSFKTEGAAIRYGKNKSFQKTFYNGTKIVHEVYIRMYDEVTDRVSVWFIKDGKITHSDVG